MEEALPQVIHAEPLERKLLKALKHGEIEGITWDEQIQDAIAKSVISEAEAAILVHVRNLVMDIIAVDEFDPQDMRSGVQLPQKLDNQHAA